MAAPLQMLCVLLAAKLLAMVIERVVKKTFSGTTIHFKDFQQLVDQFEDERFHSPIVEFVRISQTSSSTTVEFITRQ
jgi:hypothetical protein